MLLFIIPDNGIIMTRKPESRVKTCKYVASLHTDFILRRYVKGDIIARIFSFSDEAADDHPPYIIIAAAAQMRKPSHLATLAF
ncbi:hypothetical protein DMH17_08010 [Raoultella planticola]|nr:hypothetical protein [Raoultella planticola]